MTCGHPRRYEEHLLVAFCMNLERTSQISIMPEEFWIAERRKASSAKILLNSLFWSEVTVRMTALECRSNLKLENWKLVEQIFETQLCGVTSIFSCAKNGTREHRAGRFSTRSRQSLNWCGPRTVLDCHYQRTQLTAYIDCIISDKFREKAHQRSCDLSVHVRYCTNYESVDGLFFCIDRVIWSPNDHFLNILHDPRMSSNLVPVSHQD